MKKQRLKQWRPSPTPKNIFCDKLLALFNGCQIARVANKATLERDGFRRVREEVLRLDGAEYGERIVATLSRQLATESGRAFEETRLKKRAKTTNELRHHRPKTLELLQRAARRRHELPGISGSESNWFSIRDYNLPYVLKTATFVAELRT